MSNCLTDRQIEVYDVLVDHWAKFGSAPTTTDICIALGFKSNNAAMQHLEALAKKGRLEKLPGKRGYIPTGLREAIRAELRPATATRLPGAPDPHRRTTHNGG